MLLSRHEFRFVDRATPVCLIARVPVSAHVAQQRVLTMPVINMDNSLLATSNSTIAAAWAIAAAPECIPIIETLSDTHQRSLMLNMSVVVLMNMWCDLATGDIEGEVHFAPVDITRWHNSFRQPPKRKKL